MKKTITLVTVCLFTTVLFAQKKSTTPYFGVRAGANFSNIIKTDDNDFSTQIKAGFTFGGFIDLPLANVFSIQPELQFSQKGYFTNGTALGTNYEYSVTTNFIEVPVLAKLKPSKDFAILVGPQFSFLTSTHTKLKSGNQSIINDVNEDNDNLRKNILGGVLGIEATADNIVFGLRYAIDFQNNNGDGTSSTPRYKNQVLALTLGVRF